MELIVQKFWNAKHKKLILISLIIKLLITFVMEIITIMIIKLIIMKKNKSENDIKYMSNDENSNNIRKSNNNESKEKNIKKEITNNF